MRGTSTQTRIHILLIGGHTVTFDNTTPSRVSRQCVASGNFRFSKEDKERELYVTDESIES
jgi:hypothetical protein